MWNNHHKTRGTLNVFVFFLINFNTEIQSTKNNGFWTIKFSPKHFNKEKNIERGKVNRTASERIK